MSLFAKRNKAGRKLDSTKVAAIRQHYAEGATQGSLARHFGVSAVQIGRIVRGESWQESAEVQLPSQEDMQVSAQRMWELQQQKALATKPVERGAPPSLLDGGDAPDETTGTGLAAMQQKARELLGK